MTTLTHDHDEDDFHANTDQLTSNCWDDRHSHCSGVQSLSGGGERPCICLCHKQVERDHAAECGTRCVWGDPKCPIVKQEADR